MQTARRIVVAAVMPMLLAGCVTDAATRIAYDIEAAAGRIGSSEGDGVRIVHRTPSKSGECAGPYRVQFDQVGALIVWCKAPDGVTTESSHSTTYHARFVQTAATVILDKRAREPLVIELERRGGRIVIAKVD